MLVSFMLLSLHQDICFVDQGRLLLATLIEELGLAFLLILNPVLSKHNLACLEEANLHSVHSISLEDGLLLNVARLVVENLLAISHVVSVGRFFLKEVLARKLIDLPIQGEVIQGYKLIRSITEDRDARTLSRALYEGSNLNYGLSLITLAPVS